MKKRAIRASELSAAEEAFQTAKRYYQKAVEESVAD
jgi:hypothetical protein